MIGPLDYAMLMAGKDPQSYPEACHMAAVVWRARVEAAGKDGSTFLNRETQQPLTADEALVLGTDLVVILEPDN